jgi:glucosamine-6-phosphate deaminase
VRLASRSQAVAQDYGAASAPASGITLGIARLLESNEIWLLVTGQRKAGILVRALLGPEGAEVPASFLRRHPNYRVVADRSAAAEIPRA